jgi:hypothetical protein
VEVLTVVATVAAAVAALAALGALYVAWKTLQEGRDTIAELRELRKAAQAETEATRETVQALQLMLAQARDSTRALQVLLAEAQLARELEQLQGIATEVAGLQLMFRHLRTSVYLDWPTMSRAQDLLKTLLVGMPKDQLPKCRDLTTADPRVITHVEDDAMNEVQAATAEARKRLAAAGASSV